MPEYYQAICGAVRESAGQTAIWDGNYIEPLFHAVSAGRTREGDEAHPYLASVAAKEDEGAGGYLTRQGMTREELKKRLEEKHDNIAKQKERILNEANEKAQNILQDAKDYADHTIRTMNKLSKSGGVDMKALEQERSRVRDKLNQSNNRKKAAPAAQKAKVYAASDFKQGDSVHVRSLDLKGTVVSQPNSKGELSIQMGILKSRIHFSDLEPIDEEVINTPMINKTGSGKIKMNKAAHVNTSINLIGETVDEAMIDLDKYLVTIGGADVTLTKKEVELLWTLAKNSSKVFSRENLLDSIWGYDYFGDSRTVDSHIKRLRAKVDKFEHEEWEIKTIWGVGYRFEEKEHAQ